MSKAKAIVGLDCEARRADGIRLLLRHRFEEMCCLRQGALDWSDIEGVHDMRVASRRLRSALRDFKQDLKWRKFRHTSNAIKRIADSLGAVRDKDVSIAALELLAANAPPDVAVGIKQFATDRSLQRVDDRAALVDAVTDDKLITLRADFDASLDAALASSHDGRSREINDQAEVSFRAAGQLIIKARMQELQGLSSSLYRPLTTKPLHRMRIAAKRLRYAIEMFSQCWYKQLDLFAKEVAEMQTSLGELHDCDVWIAEFGGLLEKQDAGIENIDPLEIVDAIKHKRDASFWLLNHFTKRRTNQYRDALARWHEWESTDFFARLEACTRSLSVNEEQSSAAFSIAVAGASDADSHQA